MDEFDLLRRELARERAARKQAEDVLEQKSLELYHRNRDLETEVAERRRIEANLRESGAELARSNAELEQFAYIASHDLQAPLRGIIGFSQLLRRRLEQQFAQVGAALDDESREYLQFIDGSAHQLRGIIRDLLEFSRVGRGTAEVASVPLPAALGRALSELAPVLHSSGATVEQAAAATVRADEGQLTQLLRNLIDNGIKYVAAGTPPRLRVTAETRDDQVLVAVADNGIGVPEAQRERIFQIFQRLHSSEEYPGTGVGLAICRKVVERWGGRLWVESGKDSGSVFCFTLPKGEP